MTNNLAGEMQYFTNAVYIYIIYVSALAPREFVARVPMISLL
jgi:hypothetical protein